MTNNPPDARFLFGVLQVAILLCASNALSQSHDEDAFVRTGVWSGYYQPANSDRGDTQFFVEAEPEEPSGYSLVIQLLVNPQDEFRFIASDLEVGRDTVSFRFGVDGDFRSCDLDMNSDAELAGTCRRDEADSESAPARIRMEPPPAIVTEESDVADEDGQLKGSTEYGDTSGGIHE